VIASKGQPAAVQAQIRQISFGIVAAKADPEIDPGIFLICLVKSLYFRFDEKAGAGLQLILCISHIVPAFSLQNIVQDIVRADGRSETVQRSAFGIPAGTQIQVAEFVVR